MIGEIMRPTTDILFFGSFPLTFLGYLIYTLVMTHITIVTVTVYYHRTMSHRALELNHWVEHFFRFWGWLTTGMNVKEWVAIHRHHHSKDDGPEDPHSPWVYGIWYVLFYGVTLYYKAAKDSAMVMRHGQGTPKDWIERRLYSRRKMYARFYGVTLMLIIDLFLFGLIGALIWLVQMIWIPFWAAGVINGLGHWPMFEKFFGYRNFDTKDRSANIIPWGIWIGGEELHNNHHLRPQSAKLSLKWYEFDIGWMYIRLLELCGLARVKYTMDPSKDQAIKTA
jgi:stearoyl-CoA desaturase (Delta-9 desaturase)